MKRQYHKNRNLKLKAMIFNATAVTCMGMGGQMKDASVQHCTWGNTSCCSEVSSGEWGGGETAGSPQCGSLGHSACHISWLWWWRCCSVVFLGLSVEESTECVRTETTRRVFFRKKKKVSTRCTTNRMTVTHEGDHDENRAHVLLLTLRNTTSLSCPRWPLSFDELQMLFYHCQRSHCFLVCLWYKHWNRILICKRNYDVGGAIFCSGAPSLGIWWHWLCSWSQVCHTLPLALGPRPGMLNWKMSKARNLLEKCPWLSPWYSLRVAQSSLRELGSNNALPDFPPSSCQADIYVPGCQKCVSETAESWCIFHEDGRSHVLHH